MHTCGAQYTVNREHHLVCDVCVRQQFLLKTQILIKIQIRLLCIDRQISLQFFRSDSFIPVYCQRDIAEINDFFSVIFTQLISVITVNYTKYITDLKRR